MLIVLISRILHASFFFALSIKRFIFSNTGFALFISLKSCIMADTGIVNILHNWSSAVKMPMVMFPCIIEKTPVKIIENCINAESRHATLSLRERILSLSFFLRNRSVFSFLNLWMIVFSIFAVWMTSYPDK